jgi:uncharacterized protein
MNILSIKSGGCRGLISLKILMHIEEITGKPIYELFDFCSGSSVGSLIVCGILLSEDGKTAKYTAHQLYELFYKNLTNCFSWTYYSYLYSFFGLLGPVYTNCGLVNIVKECCAESKLSNLLKPIIFPTYDKNSNKNYYFNNKDQDVLLSDIVMSCSAAPTYFPSHPMTLNDVQYDFIDSGLVSVSSIRLAVLEAIKHAPIDKSKVLMVNIGTGAFNLPKADYNGLLSWAPNIVTTLMNASHENEIFELSLILPKDNYYIMDVPLDIKYYHMDDISPTTISYYLNETDKWINDNTDNIKLFCDKLLLNKK